MKYLRFYFLSSNAARQLFNIYIYIMHHIRPVYVTRRPNNCRRWAIKWNVCISPSFSSYLIFHQTYSRSCNFPSSSRSAFLCWTHSCLSSPRKKYVGCYMKESWENVKFVVSHARHEIKSSCFHSNLHLTHASMQCKEEFLQCIREGVRQSNSTVT